MKQLFTVALATTSLLFAPMCSAQEEEEQAVAEEIAFDESGLTFSYPDTDWTVKTEPKGETGPDIQIQINNTKFPQLTVIIAAGTNERDMNRTGEDTLGLVKMVETFTKAVLDGVLESHPGAKVYPGLGVVNFPETMELSVRYVVAPKEGKEHIIIEGFGNVYPPKGMTMGVLLSRGSSALEMDPGFAAALYDAYGIIQTIHVDSAKLFGPKKKKK